MSVWRIGRSLGRTLYLQRGDDPSKSDEFVGLMEDRDLAEAVVRAMNKQNLPPPADSLAEELGMVLNRHSAENESNTPDYLLAEYLMGALNAYNQATKARDKWYNIQPGPGWGTTTTTL